MARSLGYVIVTKRSKTKNVYLSKIILMCDRGGVCKSRDRGGRETPSKKIDCKFELVEKYYKILNVWKLTVKCHEHNHESAMYMEGHPYARRLTDYETRFVAEMTNQNMKARDILSTLKELNKNNVSTSRTIYNAQQKLRFDGHEGRTPIQVVFSFLQKKGYDFEYRTNNSTNKLEELFFVHPISLKILLAFPHVLLMDATYKTNKHNVTGDGNCGFRAIAACLGHDESSWRQIRMDLLNALSMNNTIYTSLVTKDGLQLLQNTLNHFEEGFAPKEHWMYMPETCLVIASRYNVLVIFLSKQGSTMCLPLCSSPPESQPPYICVIARVNDNHFVRLELQGDFPIPPTHPQWSYYAFDPTWENLYFDRQNMYNQLNRNSGYIKTRINVED